MTIHIGLFLSPSYVHVTAIVPVTGTWANQHIDCVHTESFNDRRTKAGLKVYEEHLTF